MTGRRITSDVGRFAVVPLWLLERVSNDSALRTWIEIAARADVDSRELTKGRRPLAEILGMSVRTLDRHTKILRAAGALEVETEDLDGVSVPACFRVILAEPAEQLALVGGDTSVARGDRCARGVNGVATRTTTQAVDQEPQEPPPRAGAQKTENQRLAEALLDSSSQAQYLLRRLADVDDAWAAIKPPALIKLGRKYTAPVVITALGFMREESRGEIDAYPYLESVCVRVRAERGVA